MTPAKRGRPSHDRTVEARVYLSPAEVAQIDALRGETPRSEWIRERVLRATSIETSIAECVERLIITDPRMLSGAPHVRGTRLSVRVLLEMMTNGATYEQILETYPQLTREGLSAAMEYGRRHFDVI